ncbi:hypothetical protein D8770_18445 [Methylobacterium sp. DB1607]|nr:hypothetical protein [Methylobacterium sp. DB1607]
MADDRCPCGRGLMLGEGSGFETCSVCLWDDDGQGDRDADSVRGGSDRGLSLTEACRNDAAREAADPIDLRHVCPPTASERSPTTSSSA